MKHKTLLKIATVVQICEEKDKSTEYTYQLIQDICNVPLDVVNAFYNLGVEKHKELFIQVNAVVDTAIELNDHFKPDNIIN